MPGRITLLVVALAHLALACAGTDSSKASAQPPAAAAEALAPRPFTADEIREANPPGTVIVFRSTTAAGVTHEHFEFGETDGETVQLGGTTTDEQGQVLEWRAPVSVTWVELRDHASFPAASTECSSASVSVAGGTFPCRRYAVTQPDGTLETYHFATQQPGPPVLLTVESDGVVELRMELLEVRQPG